MMIVMFLRVDSYSVQGNIIINMLDAKGQLKSFMQSCFWLGEPTSGVSCQEERWGAERINAHVHVAWREKPSETRGRRRNIPADGAVSSDRLF